MKNSFLFLLLLISTTFSCEFIDPDGGIIIDGLDHLTSFEVSPCEDGGDVELANLPQVIQDYLNQEFPGATINHIELFQEESSSAFGIRLDNGMEILFDEDGVIIRSSDDNSERQITLEELQAGILDFISTNYPGLEIDHAETEIEYGNTYVEIHLSDGRELYFDLQGNFLCDDEHGDDDHDWSDDDDDDENEDHSDDGSDDDEVAISDLPPAIVEFITANYADYSIDEAKKEDLCDDQDVYEVELERENERNEPELYFDLDGNFLFASVEMNAIDLPDAVKAAIESDYSGYRIDDDKVERYDYPDGSVQYKVKLEDRDDDDVKVIFGADGTVICED